MALPHKAERHWCGLRALVVQRTHLLNLQAERECTHTSGGAGGAGGDSERFYVQKHAEAHWDHLVPETNPLFGCLDIPSLLLGWLTFHISYK